MTAVLAVIFCLCVPIFSVVGESNSDARSYWTYTMDFDSSDFSFTYADDAEGFTGATDESDGSWDMLNNALLKTCYYAVFDSNGTIVGKLNPDDLTKYTDGSDASSDITTMNVMFCVPTIYFSSSLTSITISSDPSKGEAYAHTIGDHVYNTLAIAVFNGQIIDGKLMSVSGTTVTNSQTLATFRTAAYANTVDNGQAMVWNYWQYTLYEWTVLFSGGDWNSQATFGQGSDFTTQTTGSLNSSGVFSKSGTTSVKAYIENPWGYQYTFVDDTYISNGSVYAGQNETVTDITTTSDKTLLHTSAITSGNFVSEIDTSSVGAWGWATATSGTSITGTTDKQYITSSNTGVLLVGGTGASDGSAGVSCACSNSVGNSYSDCGARLAYVFDADPASYPVTFNVNGGTTSVTAGTCSDGVNFEVPGYAGAKEGFAFSGWKCSLNDVTYTAGQSIPGSLIESGFTLTAQWTAVAPDSVVVRLDVDGGKPTMPDTEVVIGSSFTVPEYNGVKDGFTFTNWVLSTDGSKTFTAGDVIDDVTENLTLVAVWTPLPTDSGSDPEVQIAIVAGIAALILTILAFIGFRNVLVVYGDIICTLIAVVALGMIYL